MPQYFSVGSSLITEKELKDNTPKIDRFFTELSRNKTPEDVLLPTGVLSVRTLNAPKPKRGHESNLIPFQQIGPGKPLQIMIRSIYTGRYPQGYLGNPVKDLLVTSSVKSFATYDAQPQAVNMLKKGVGRNCFISRPGGDEPGTPIVFYSPAVVDQSLTLTLRFIFDEFPKELFGEFDTLLKSAGAIPVFLTSSLYLTVAGSIVNLLGKVGEHLLDGKPAFESSIPIDLDLSGADKPIAGFRVIFDEDVDVATRTKYQVNKKGEVVDNKGKPFTGDIPYVVISCDGKVDDNLKDFAPTAATAEVLGRFFSTADGGGDSALLMDALKIYNDVHFRKKVDEIDAKIKKTSSATEKAKLKKERDALVANISDELIKPKK